jgi:hypothetical protein
MAVLKSAVEDRITVVGAARFAAASASQTARGEAAMRNKDTQVVGSKIVRGSLLAIALSLALVPAAARRMPSRTSAVLI